MQRFFNPFPVGNIFHKITEKNPNEKKAKLLNSFWLLPVLHLLKVMDFKLKLSSIFGFMPQIGPGPFP